MLIAFSLEFTLIIKAYAFYSQNCTFVILDVHLLSPCFCETWWSHALKMCVTEAFRKSSSKEHFVPKLETRRPGIVSCGLWSLLVWIFHSDEHSQWEQKLYLFFFHWHLSLYSKMMFQLSILPLSSPEPLPTDCCNITTLHASMENRLFTVIFVLFIIFQETVSFLEPWSCQLIQGMWEEICKLWCRSAGDLQ